jgi:hypothetical protein
VGLDLVENFWHIFLKWEFLLNSFLRLYMGSKNRIVEKKLVHLAGDTGSFEYTVFGLALHLVA